MNFLRVLALFLCSVILFVATFALAVAKSADQILEAKTITSLLEKYGLYEKIEDLAQGAAQGVKITDLEEDGAEAFIARLLTNIFSYLKGRTDALDATINVDNSAILDFFEQQAANFPVCSPGQNPWNKEEPVCRPANIPSLVYLRQVLDQKGFNLPQEGVVNLQEVYDKDNKFAQFREIYATAKKIWLATFVGALVLAGLVFLLCRRSLCSALRWIGTPIFLGGGLLAAVSILALPLAMQYAPLPEQALAYQSYITDAASMAASVLQTNALIVLVLGAALIAGSFFFKKYETHT